MIERYITDFMNLAKEECISLDESRLRQVLSRDSSDEIERAYNACLRFGIKNMLDAISSLKR